MQTTQKYVCSYLRGKEYKEYPSQTSCRIEAMSNLTLTCPLLYTRHWWQQSHVIPTAYPYTPNLEYNIKHLITSNHKDPLASHSPSLYLFDKEDNIL